VRCGRSGPAGKNHCRARMATDGRGNVRPRFLYSRRISEHSCADTAKGSGCPGLGDSSGSLSAHKRNPADYRCSGFHSWKIRRL